MFILLLISNSTYEFVIIGGGSTGTVMTLELSLRGLKVALI